MKEMERQTEEIQQKMEAQLAAEVRQGSELRERIEALQDRKVWRSFSVEFLVLDTDQLNFFG